MTFTGSVHARLDAKGRVFFPAQFRRQIAEGGVVGDVELVMKTDAYAPCLVIYTKAAWESELADLSTRLNRWNPREAAVLRQFMSDVEVLALDANGRFILPKRYQQAAGVEREVTFIGMADRIEVWARERAEQPFLAPDDYSAALQELLGTSHKL